MAHRCCLAQPSIFPHIALNFDFFLLLKKFRDAFDACRSCGSIFFSAIRPKIVKHIMEFLKQREQIKVECNMGKYIWQCQALSMRHFILLIVNVATIPLCIYLPCCPWNRAWKRGSWWYQLHCQFFSFI